MPFVIIGQMLYNLSPAPSDQLIETTTNINRLLGEGGITQEEAQKLIDAARLTEGLSRYFGLPLEDGSAQTPQLEARRMGLLSRR